MTGGGLVDELRIGEERPRHGDHVRIALGQHLLGDLRGIDPVGGDQRNAYLATQLRGHLGERGAWHLGGDGRNPRLVPTDAGIDQRGARLLDGLGQLHHLFPDTAAFDEVEHRQAIDDDEVTAHRFAHAAHDLHRQAHAILVAASPAIGAVVGVRHQELIDEVAFRTHDLDAVITGLLGQACAVDEVADLLLDALLVQFARGERIDRRLDSARRNQLRAVGVTPGMQDLHADLAASFVNRLGNDLVLFGLLRRGQLGRPGAHRAFLIGADATGDDQADATAGTLCEECRHPLEAVGHFLQARVHGAHQGTVAQGGKAQIERSQQFRESGHRSILIMTSAEPHGATVGMQRR